MRRLKLNPENQSNHIGYKLINILD